MQEDFYVWIIVYIMVVTQAKFYEGTKRLQASLDKILAEQKSFSVSIVALQDKVRQISANNANLRDKSLEMILSKKNCRITILRIGFWTSK